MSPKRFNGPLPLNITDLPRVDLVIISHDHYDHLNRFTIRALRQKADHFIVPSGVDQHLIAWGYSKKRSQPWNGGNPTKFPTT